MTETSSMPDGRTTFQIHPGRGLGWMNLGASIHGVISRIKSQPQLFPRLKLSYSLENPISQPLHVELPDNDIRLQFDGPDQRLRLIEITGWSQASFTYKSVEVVRHLTQSDKMSEANTVAAGTTLPGPSFRHIYNRLFGPAYAGVYIPPNTGQNLGTYVLSYPGLAIRFPLKHSAYSDKADFVSLLSSAALPATSIAIFSGASWPEAKSTLFTKPPSLPRSIALASKNNESVPDEIENIIIHGGGKIELLRRSSPPMTIVLSETTPQDLVAELGPPDAIFRKSSTRISIHAGQQSSIDQLDDISAINASGPIGTNRSSDTSHLSNLRDETDATVNNQSDTDASATQSECFYNYFHHGFDILVSRPTTRSQAFPGYESTQEARTPIKSENKLVATKMFLHGNIPGSYSFNRHRRSRWIIPLPPSFTPSNLEPQHTPASRPDETFAARQSTPKDKKKPPGRSDPASADIDPRFANTQQIVLTSEMQFPQIAQTLNTLWPSNSQYTSKGMVLNRGWSADQDSSPESSVELLGGAMTMDDSGIVSAPVKGNPSTGTNTNTSTNTRAKTTTATATAAVEKSGGNTQLFGFPGMLFEVLDYGGVSCVTIY